MHVFGTETHMTAIVGMALGKTPIPEKSAVCDSNDMASMFFNPNDVSSDIYLFVWLFIHNCL